MVQLSSFNGCSVLPTCPRGAGWYRSAPGCEQCCWKQTPYLRGAFFPGQILLAHVCSEDFQGPGANICAASLVVISCTRVTAGWHWESSALLEAEAALQHEAGVKKS